MTLQLPLHDGQNTQAILDLIAKSAIDTGGRSIKLRWGTSPFTFAAGATVDGVTVTHGLGSTPIVVLLTAAYANDGHQCDLNVSSTAPPTSTQFTYGARDTSGIANSQTHTAYWVAIG